MIFEVFGWALCKAIIIGWELVSIIHYTWPGTCINRSLHQALIQYQAAHPKLINYTTPCKLWIQDERPSPIIFEESSLQLWLIKAGMWPIYSDGFSELTHFQNYIAKLNGNFCLKFNYLSVKCLQFKIEFHITLKCTDIRME